MAAGFALKGARELADVQAYGVKAAGLAMLPPDWTPGFAVFATATPDRIDGYLSLLGEIGAVLRALTPGSDGVIVRSSSVAEDLSGRGSLDSGRRAADPHEIRRAMGTIATRAGVRRCLTGGLRDSVLDTGPGERTPLKRATG